MRAPNGMGLMINHLDGCLGGAGCDCARYRDVNPGPDDRRVDGETLAEWRNLAERASRALRKSRGHRKLAEDLLRVGRVGDE